MYVKAAGLRLRVAGVVSPLVVATLLVGNAFSYGEPIIPAWNETTNPTFESNLQGWKPVGSVISRVARDDAPEGAYVALVDKEPGVSNYRIQDDPQTISASVTGTTYTAQAWVRRAATVAQAKQIGLYVREKTAGGALVDQTYTRVRLTATFQRIATAYRAQESGNRIETFLKRPPTSSGTLVSGEKFYADAYSLTPSQESCEFGSFSPVSPPGACWRPYSSASPFNNAVPVGAQEAPNSQGIVNRLVDGGEINPPVAGDPARDSGNPTYWSQPNDPLFTLDCTAEFGGTCDTEGMQIRIPDDALPAGGHVAAPPWQFDGPDPTAFGNLTANPSFESTVAGWGGLNATVTRVAQGDAPHGSYVGRVSWNGSENTYTIDDDLSAEGESRAGNRYTARAWVKGTSANDGEPLDLIVREWDENGSYVDDTQSTITLSSSEYRKVEATHIAAQSDGEIDIYLRRLDSTLPQGDEFFVDAVQMLQWVDHDAHMTVVDQASGWEYDFWNVQSKPQGGGTLMFGWGGRTRVEDGDGLGSEAVAAGYGNLAGIIRAQELEAGAINHALVMVAPCTESFVYPAAGIGLRCSDAGMNVANSAPMGSLLHLDMTEAEIEALDLPPYAKTIFKALAHYGAYVSDTTGAEDQWGSFEIESGWTYESFGIQDNLVAFAKIEDLSPWDFNENYPCPVPSLSPGACKPYEDANDPGDNSAGADTMRDERWFSLTNGISWTELEGLLRDRLQVIDPCVPDPSC